MITSFGGSWKYSKVLAQIMRNFPRNVLEFKKSDEIKTMKKIRHFFRKFHIYASIFFLPMALLYTITGILYISGIRQDHNLEQQKFSIFAKDPIQDLRSFTLDFLKENHLAIPSDTALKKDSRGKGFVMGSAGYFITIEKKEKSINITTNKRSFIGNSIMLHKAKVAKPFVIFSIVFSAMLLLFYFSAFVMTSWCSQNRKASLLFFLLGLLTAITTALVSL
ncbi:integral membrane protein [Helicobacter mustelae]|nr:integral membrane protein [Helicobacter mustelae]